MQILSSSRDFYCNHNKVSKLKTEIEKLRSKLSNKDEETAESIREAFGEMQKASLKLFELAYKKVLIIAELIYNVSSLPLLDGK